MWWHYLKQFVGNPGQIQGRADELLGIALHYFCSETVYPQVVAARLHSRFGQIVFLPELPGGFVSLTKQPWDA
jgi:hypothetical protein